MLIFNYAPHPDITIYDLQNPYDFLILIPQLLGLVGFFWSFNYLCASEIIGIGQIKRWLRNEYDMEDLDEKTTLNIRGPFRYVRHPVYFFSILFLISRPTMDLFYLITFICAVIYFYIGSIYEERKLVEEYGDLYTQYQAMVPRILPLKIFNPYKIKETF
ncbi:MAG: isoprenylcysteine carboxylmethyltransferase family protein [Bacteroidetes bacterium]|nr:isoprenylcysteine carboxylmethyltransferase family protein [Bacteroidota bacterium]